MLFLSLLSSVIVLSPEKMTRTSYFINPKPDNRTSTMPWERSCSVVECLTRDRGAAGSCVTAKRPWARHINPSLVLVQHRKTRPYITERLLMRRKRIKSNKQKFKRAITNLFLTLKFSSFYNNHVKTDVYWTWPKMHNCNNSHIREECFAL